MVVSLYGASAAGRIVARYHLLNIAICLTSGTLRKLVQDFGGLDRTVVLNNSASDEISRQRTFLFGNHILKMSVENVLFDNLSNPSFTTYLQAMRLSLVKFSKIHSSDIFQRQVANAHETYLPITLEWGDSQEVSVNDIFSTDFTEYYGTYDAASKLHKPKVFVIFGTQGSGKSSLAYYLHYQWVFEEAKEVKNIKDFHLAFVFEVDKVKRSSDLPKVTSVMNCSFFPEGTTEEEARRQLAESKVLWIVDGFDRAPLMAREVVRDLIMACPLSQFVITSRWTGIRHMNELFHQLEYSVQTVTLKLKPLPVDTWIPMIPKIIAANTRREEIIEDLSSKVIASLDKSISAKTEIYPYDLAVFVKALLEAKYGFLEGETLTHEVLPI